MHIYDVNFVDKNKRKHLVQTEMKDSLPQVDLYLLNLPGVKGAVVDSNELVFITKVEGE